MFREPVDVYKRQVHTCGDIRALLMDEALDGKTGRIVAYFSENRTDNRRDRRFIQAGDLPGDNNLPSGSHHFAGYTGEGVMGKALDVYKRQLLHSPATL